VVKKNKVKKGPSTFSKKVGSIPKKHGNIINKVARRHPPIKRISPVTKKRLVVKSHHKHHYWLIFGIILFLVVVGLFIYMMNFS